MGYEEGRNGGAVSMLAASGISDIKVLVEPKG